MFFDVFLGWLVGHVLGIVVHEAGHALAAIATGMRVKKVVIGWGGTVFTCECRRVRIEFNRIPGGGVTHIAGNIHLRKGAELFVLLAGSLGNLVLLVATVAVWYYGLLPVSADYVILGFICAQIFLIIFALVPDAASVTGGGGCTDGTRIASVLKQKHGSLSPVAECHLHSLTPYVKGQKYSPTLSPASPRLIDIHYALHHSDAELPDEVVEAAGAELDKGEMSLEEELMVLDALVTQAVVKGNQKLRAGMDAWSERAIARGAHISTIRFSRAAVLIEVGRFEEGKAMLGASTQPSDHPVDAILNTIFLAKAEAGLQNHREAKELLIQADGRITDELSPEMQREVRPLWKITSGAVLSHDTLA